MNAGATAALVVAGACAAIDWVAVARGSRRAEFVAKPAALAALVVAAALLDPDDGGQRAWFVAALVFSLIGDVFLMLPSDRFVPGLAAFLLAHLAYVVGFVVGGVTVGEAIAGAVPVIPTTVIVGSRVLHAIRLRGDSGLRVPVLAYMAAISTMAVLAFREPLSAAGAALFYGSDALIAWNRFVEPLRWAPVAIIVTYHVGQAALVVSLT